MRANHRSFVAASALGALTSLSCAQDCLWTYHSAYPEYGGWPYPISLYDADLHRVVFVDAMVSPPQVSAWDGSQWSPLSSGGLPQRNGGAAAYDSARGRIVYFGGQPPGTSGGTTYYNETWEWDGVSWTLRAAVGPSPRAYQAMAYDATRQRTVLFSGQSASGLAGDTWEWDGQTWAQVATTGPTPRRMGSMAYDSTRARTVLCGGFVWSYGDLDDLWEWDGTTWAERTDIHPGQVRWIVHDPARARLIVGRGQTNLLADGETWDLDPLTAQWTLRDPGTSLWAPVAFDPVRARVVAATGEFNPAGSLFAPYIVQQPSNASVLVGDSVVLTVQADGSGPLTYQWQRFEPNVNWQNVSNGGNISGADTATLTIGPIGVVDDGDYRVVITNSCRSSYSGEASVSVGTGSTCYANCDSSTTLPVVNVADFTCFLQKFAAGDLWANCDSSTGPPTLNVADFTCFLQKFAAGCP